MLTGDTVLYLVAWAAPPLLAWLAMAFFRRFVRGRDSAMSWPMLMAGNLLVFLLFTSVFFLGLETYYRFVYDESVGDNRTKVSRRWFERHWQTNTNGVRDNRAYALAKTAGTRRITFIGDSFTAGHGIKDVGERFVNRVRKALPDREVQSFAVLGWDTATELEGLESIFAMGYETDGVVLVYTANDISGLVPEWKDVYFRWMKRPESLSFALDHSYFLDLYHYRFLRWWNSRNPDEDDFRSLIARAYDADSPTWQEHEAKLTEFRDALLAHGVDFAVVTFPVMHGQQIETQIATHRRLGGSGTNWLFRTWTFGRRSRSTTVGTWSSIATTSIPTNSPTPSPPARSSTS